MEIETLARSCIHNAKSSLMCIFSFKFFVKLGISCAGNWPFRTTWCPVHCSKVPRAYHFMIKHLGTTHLAFFLLFCVNFLFIRCPIIFNLFSQTFQNGRSTMKALQAAQQRNREDWFILTFASPVPVQEVRGSLRPI